MRKLSFFIFLLVCCPLCLSSCESAVDKSSNLSIVYGITAIAALLILVGYTFAAKQKNKWLLVLFLSVSVVNCGYYWLSVSSSLNEALWANRLAYLGSVFLPLAMLMIILKAIDIKYKSYLPFVLMSISIVMFLIAASPGYSNIYYSDVTFEIIDGVGTLNKEEYGPLHNLYTVYLLGYFGTMMAFVIKSFVKKTSNSTAPSLIIATAVFINILVWLVEKIVKIDIEILSISYIITELFLLGLESIINENQKLLNRVKVAEEEASHTQDPVIEAMYSQTDDSVQVDNDQFDIFKKGMENLTKTERLIFDAYIARVTTKEIMATLNIKENTLKFHNKNIYSKLGVSSRKQLLEIYKQINQ